MSSAIICDKCSKAMYADSRSDKDAYAKKPSNIVEILRGCIYARNAIAVLQWNISDLRKRNSRKNTG